MASETDERTDLERNQELINRRVMRQQQLLRTQHVLFHLGDHALGLQPGSFVAHLLRAFFVADPGNFRRLSAAFPEYGQLVHDVRWDDKLEDLRATVKASL